MGMISNDSNENKKFLKNTFCQGEGRGEGKEESVCEKEMWPALVLFVQMWRCCSQTS